MISTLQLPIVANDCEGVKEVIGTDFGYTVKQKSDAKEFANKMLEIMNGGVKFDKQKLKERSLAFEINTISDQWNNLIKK